MDHTGIDIIARNPHKQELMGISVKSRCRYEGKEKEEVYLREDDIDKARNACRTFECEPYFAVVVDAGKTIRAFILPMGWVRDQLKKRTNGVYPWRMTETALRSYEKDEQIKMFGFETGPTNQTGPTKWWGQRSVAVDACARAPKRGRPQRPQ